MTIRATFLQYETGAEIPVTILATDKLSGTAIVQPIRASDWQHPAIWAGEPPEWQTEIFALSNIRVECPNCRTGFDPAGRCECDYDWQTPPTDDQDTALTQAQLLAEFGGR
jgi:hypothetical protein